MPWTAKQEALFRAAAHDPAIAKSHGIPQAKAASMASEGIKPSATKLATALKNMTPKEPK